MATNVELRRSNGSNFDEVIHLKTSISLVEGLLDDGKITPTLLPDFILGGMRFIDTIALTAPTTDQIYGVLNAEGSPSPYPGAYFIATHKTTITVSANHTIYFGDDGGTTAINAGGSTVLEPGDWFVFTKKVGSAIHWAVINNAYPDAATDAKGVVFLASSDDGKAGTNTTKAMTPSSTKVAISDAISNIAVATKTSSGFMSAADKIRLDAIKDHPIQSAINASASNIQTIKSIDVNTLGHVTSIETQDIRGGTQTEKGLVQFATSGTAILGTESFQALSPSTGLEMINKFALTPITGATLIEKLASLPLVTTLSGLDASVTGKLVLLKVT